MYQELHFQLPPRFSPDSSEVGRVGSSGAIVLMGKSYRLAKWSVSCSLPNHPMAGRRSLDEEDGSRGLLERLYLSWKKTSRHTLQKPVWMGKTAPAFGCVAFRRWRRDTSFVHVILLWKPASELWYCFILLFLWKDQANTRLLSDCHGLAWYISSMSMWLTAGNCASKSTHKTTVAAAVVTDNSSARWLGAEEASGTDAALIQVIHAWIMFFHFQREPVWQAHALSVLTGNLYISCAREFEQIGGSGFIPNVTGLCK